MPRTISAFKQFLDGEGDPLISGWLKFTVSGTNNTDKDTFADPSETIPNTNPVQLDAEGRAPDIFGTGSYRVVSFTNDTVLNIPAVQIQQKDPVPGGEASAGQWGTWDATTVYAQGDIRIGDDGKYYRSLSDANEGNDPADGASPEFWEEFVLVLIYNANKAYEVGELVVFTDANFYVCIIATTAGEDPVSAPTKWQLAITDLKGRFFINGVEKINALGDTGGGTVNVDWSLGDYVTMEISTAATTLTFTNWRFLPSIDGAKIGTLEILNGGSQTLTLPVESQWPGGEAEPLTEAGKDVLSVVSSDDGSAIMFFVAGLDVKVPT